MPCRLGRHVSLTADSTPPREGCKHHRPGYGAVMLADGLYVGGGVIVLILVVLLIIFLARRI